MYLIVNICFCWKYTSYLSTIISGIGVYEGKGIFTLAPYFIIYYPFLRMSRCKSYSPHVQMKNSTTRTNPELSFSKVYPWSHASFIFCKRYCPRHHMDGLGKFSVNRVCELCHLFWPIDKDGQAKFSNRTKTRLGQRIETVHNIRPF